MTNNSLRLTGTTLRRAAAIGAAFLPLTTTGAQQVGWNGRAEVSGNVLFGAARGRLVSLAAATSRADSTLEAEVDARLSYADAVADDEDTRRVTARASRLSLGADYRPFDRLSPFVFASMETSLQQRIASRFATGVGAKYTFFRKNDDDLSLSLALLWERTRALNPDSVQQATSTRTRWSLRARVRRKLTDGLKLSHVTFYQPAVDRFERYTADSNTSLALALSETLAFTITLRDHIDSEARRRGARSAHDGQLLFGVNAAF